MSKAKKIGIVLALILVIIQFIPSEKNNGQEVTEKSIVSVVNVPDDVQGLLKKSCYDCHSNTTQNMWYMNVQPVGWWIAHHIDEGKRELNFSAFSAYSLKKQAHKLEEIAEMINEDEMPLASYTLMHAKAKLNTEERELLIDWANNERQKIVHQLPEKN